MTFEQLYYFTELYRHNSINATAERLHISRQCLSKAIIKLENELDVVLFDRSVSGVVPTPAAREFYTFSTNILNEYTSIKKRMIDFSSSKYTRPISIGVPEAILSSFGEQFIEDLCERFPDTDFSMQTINKRENSNFYQSHDITIFASLGQINRLNKPMERYQLHYLFKTPMYVWCKKNSPLTQSSKISMNELKHYSFCVLRNSYNGLDFARNLNVNYNVIVDTKKNFKDKIRNGYFTMDLKMKDNKFFFEDLFESDEFTCIKTEQFMYYYILFRSDINHKYIDYVAKYISIE